MIVEYIIVGLFLFAMGFILGWACGIVHREDELEKEEKKKMWGG